jgi:hypothetical protein
VVVAAAVAVVGVVPKVVLLLEAAATESLNFDSERVPV